MQVGYVINSNVDWRIDANDVDDSSPGHSA